MLVSTLLKLLLVTVVRSVATASISHPSSVRDCKDATLVSKSTYHVDGADIAHSTYHCATPGNRFVQDYPYQNDTTTLAKNTCSSPCKVQCNRQEGILPPISDDCMTILDALLMLPHMINSPDESFVLGWDVKHVLTYETCEIFIANYDNMPLRFCYESLIGHVTDAAGGCFPPVQPYYPEGVCVSADSSWEVGVSHS